MNYYYEETRANFKDKFLKICVDSPFFTYFSNIIIIINCTVLCMNRFNISEEEFKIISIIDFICTLFYTLEVVFLLSYNPYKFFHSLLCISDLVIVCLNVINYLVFGAIFGNDIFQEEYEYTEVVRVLKFVRIFKIYYSSTWLKPLDEFLLAFVISFERLAYYIAIILIYGFTFGCIGCELLAYKARFDKGTYDVAEDPEKVIFYYLLLFFFKCIIF